MAYTYNKPSSKKTRRLLRKDLTPAEALLWKNIQRKQLDGRRFRRQYSIGSYIVDFYCVEERLVIELDGSVHDNIGSQLYDDERTLFLESLDIKVIRFENSEIFKSLDFVIEAIRQEFKQAYHYTPSPCGYSPYLRGRVKNSPTTHQNCITC
jgi:very-short-patch-repair endonuclease